MSVSNSAKIKMLFTGIVFLILVIAIVMLMNSCSRKEIVDKPSEELKESQAPTELSEEEIKANIEKIKKMSNELTKIMVLGNDYEEQYNEFLKYKDRINSTTFEKYFNTKNRITAAYYFKDGTTIDFKILETIYSTIQDSSGNDVDVVYVIYSSQVEIEDQNKQGLDSGYTYVEIDGVNKFLYRDSILVGFEKVL